MNNTQESLKMLFSKMEDFVTTKTVVGEPVTMGEITLIPLMDVSVGIATGVTATSAGANKGKGKDSGAGGMSAKMSPAAMIVINKDSVQLVNVKNQESTSKLVDMIPGILSKFNLGGIFDKFGKKDDAPSPPEPTPATE